MRPIIFMDQGIYVCCIESERMNINCAYGRGLTPASAFHHWQYLKEQLNLFEQRIIERYTQ